jgi:lysophospholipase L1-like esterase
MRHNQENITKQPLPSIRELTPMKKKVYLGITLIAPFLFIVCIELGLRFFNYGTNIPLFVSIPDENSKYYGINLDIAKRYFTKLSDVPTPRKDLFLKVKPNNGYRIFVLGESTAAGFPYGNNITFSRILNRRLSDVFPEKHIEIINTALTAVNTYTELDFLDEILQQKPDAIFIYTGHNEYYGALGVGSMESVGKYRWIVRATLVLQKMRTYQLIQNFITSIQRQFGGNDSINEMTDPSATLMERIVRSKSIPLGTKEYELGKDQFQENLRAIIEKSQDAGVKVIVSELVSNVHDNKPFESLEGDDLLSAQKTYNRALEYEKQGKYEEAKNAFYLAKDLDVLRFRAPEEFNTIIHDVANTYHVPVVPMKYYFESDSPHRIIGDNLMLEHLHPNLDGYFLMADAFFETMRKERYISDEWQEKYIKPSSYYRSRWGYTSLDSVCASLSVEQLKGGWPFKKEQRRNLALMNFKISTAVDSIAACILASRELTLEQGHIELANYYEGRGESINAFKEYNALIYTVPYFDLFYEPAVKVLVEMKKYDKALEILYELLQYQKTSFTYQWIGQIYLLMNETSKGVVFLEKAKEMEPKNMILLYNLGRAYFKISKYEKGNDILKQLKSNRADSSLISKLEELRALSSKNENE